MRLPALNQENNEICRNPHLPYLFDIIVSHTWDVSPEEFEL
jgi:hypothetical protein